MRLVSVPVQGNHFVIHKRSSFFYNRQITAVLTAALVAIGKDLPPAFNRMLDIIAI